MSLPLKLYMSNSYRLGEPRCGCCGTRMGLAISHLIFLSIGVLYLLNSLLTFGVFTILEGLLIIVASLIGLASISTSYHQKTMTLMSSYVVIGLVLLVLMIIESILIGQLATFPDIQQEEQERNRSQLRIYLGISTLVEVVIGLVIVFLVRNRTLAYRKWNGSEYFTSRSINEIDAELKTIIGEDLK